MALLHWLTLTLTDGIGPILSRRLVEKAGTAEAACAADATLLRRVDGIGPGKAVKIAAALRHAGEAAGAERARAAAFGLTLICPEDDVYPLLLRSIPDPPGVLYVKGELQPRDLNGLAIIGSRKCSFYGREQAERFGALLAGSGFTVISGGARGIDSASHRGALQHPQGRTIAVIGSGIDKPYPPENAGLFDQITAGRGCVISEFPLGTPPLADNFPKRNRVISGMSRGVLVVEAADRSGAMGTARRACDDQNRTVFAIPGRIDSPTSVGTHQLLRDGAVFTTGLDDILDGLPPLDRSLPDGISLLLPATLVVQHADDEVDLHPGESSTGGLFATAGDTSAQSSPPTNPSSTSPSSITPSPTSPSPAGRVAVPSIQTLSPRQQQLIDAFTGDALNADALVTRTGLPPQAVLQELTILSLRRLIERVDGQTYRVRG